MWIILENRSFSEVVGAPYLSSLAARGGLATNMHNLSHPSQPNYIAMTSGKPISQVPATDCPTFCPVHGASIFGQTPSWRVYAESMPSNCLSHDAGLYRAHHTAAPYFVDLTNCQTSDVPLTQFNPASLPLFSMVVPNVAHDMHQGSSSVAAGDSWLQGWLPQVLSSADYTSGSLAVFITWDEGGTASRTTKNCMDNTTDPGCHIATYVLSRHTPPGVQSSALLNLYSILHTTEELLNLPVLGMAAAAPDMLTPFGL